MSDEARWGEAGHGMFGHGGHGGRGTTWEGLALALTPEEKHERKRARMLQNMKQYRVGTNVTKVARVFQRMIRAEYAFVALLCQSEYWSGGDIAYRECKPGQVVCITCGKVHSWKSKAMHTGHFIHKANSVKFDERNVAPQCAQCNQHHSGRPDRYEAWMIAVRGQAVVDELKRLKHETRSFTLDELVDMKIEYRRRLNEAVRRMEG